MSRIRGSRLAGCADLGPGCGDSIRQGECKLDVMRPHLDSDAGVIPRSHCLADRGPQPPSAARCCSATLSELPIAQLKAAGLTLLAPGNLMATQDGWHHPQGWPTTLDAASQSPSWHDWRCCGPPCADPVRADHRQRPLDALLSGHPWSAYGNNGPWRGR